MFLFDATVTFLLAVVGYFYLPDYPHNTVWLNPSEQKLAIQRVGDTTNKQNTLSNFTKLQKIKQLLKNKFLYLFMFSWATVHIALGAPRVLGIVAKKLGFDAVTANLLTTVKKSK
jgi:ACS family pantothenate transporter-like MFS transporter